MKLYDKEVVVWAWCNASYNEAGNLFQLDDSRWTPYIKHQNQIIENEFNNNKESATIILPIDDTVRNIVFKTNNHYAVQIDPLNNNIRLVKRITMSSSKLNNLLNNMSILSTNYDIHSKINNSHDTPIDFLCPISQTIMIDPVRTSDNKIYDKRCIQKWFKYKHTSPLTGLQLDDITLTPDIELYNKIQVYVKSIYE